MTQRLPEQYGFILPDFQIAPADQQLLVRHTKQLYLDGFIKGTSFTTRDYRGVDFVYSINTRYAMDDGKLVNSSLVNRFNDKVTWHWNETSPFQPILGTVQRIVEPLLPLYKLFTRAVILLQCENLTLPLHADYFTQWKDQHDANKHLAIKFPLTETPGDNGCPVLEVDGEVMKYSVGNNAFALNEVDLNHGSMPVNHTRGVLFLDGIIDVDALMSLPRLPIPIEKAPTNEALFLTRS
jgi:hypothetical protein